MTTGLPRFRDLRVNFNKPVADAALKRFLGMDSPMKQDLGIDNPGIGHLFIVDVPGAEPSVLEILYKDRPAGNEDVLSVLYHAHPIFNSRETYMAARKELIDLICDFADAGPDGVAFQCSIRKRKAHVRDLSIQQLLDTIELIVRRATH